MTEKTSCQFCGTHLEFDVENANEFVPCPNCGKHTRLFVSGGFLPGEKHPTPSRGKRKLSRTNFWLLVVGGPLVVIGLVLAIFCSDAGAAVSKTLGIILGCFLGGLFIWFVLAHILEILTGLFICVGLFLIVSGVFDMISIQAAKEATVFQQIYALHEFVGGALVFCATMIFHVLRSRLNPPVKEK